MPSKATEKYPQATRTFYSEPDGLPANRVNALLKRRSEIWAGTRYGIALFRRNEWMPRTERGWPEKEVTTLFSGSDGSVLAGTEEGTHVYLKGRWSKASGPAGLVGAAEDQQGQIWALGSDGLWSLHGSRWERRKRNDDGIRFTDFTWLRRGRGVASSTDGVFFLQGKRLYWYLVEAAEDRLVSKEVAGVREDGQGHIWCVTDRGISIYRPPNGWVTLQGEDGLPIENLSSLETGQPGVIWFGSDLGLIRLKEGRWSYMASKRYLPSDRVNTILPGPDGDVWVGTAGGISHIEYRMMGLPEKAQHYASLTERYHTRRGYVTIRWLSEEGNLDSGFVEVSDNDGTWTGLYLASLSFRYAVTKERGVRPLISDSLKAMLYLEEVTGIPGFPARSVRFKEDHQWNDGHPEFHLTPDGKAQWKSDTSSDEIDAHYFSLSICYDLAANEKQKSHIRSMIGRVTDHIIEHDYFLVDADGRPTTWGVWSPRKLNLDDRWKMQRGLNSLEIISHLKTAYHITGNKRYQREYERLVWDDHYALNTIMQRITILGHHTWHDDQLAMLSYYPLMLYETDDDLRQVLLLGLERTWGQLRAMKYPFWNFIYGAVTGKPCDVEVSKEHLARHPLDLVRWNIKNSVRSDFKRDPENPELALVPFPAEERTIENSDGCFFRIDGGSNGIVAQDGTIWLLPYWMGRHHGLIE